VDGGWTDDELMMLFLETASCCVRDVSTFLLFLSWGFLFTPT